ncbi:TauD/TfdA family dioxygenase [Actinoplanes bogorensis]|uniref:TauD/TfdA family dioxygenase n=1 Tax=Paractinoplanes bogorensis TaxID=1610840 RepID=A0ABS5YPM8_9ACTN|nr:TauD/TfdA family dioxygenase [Actinoplanes bogorensis]MBU2665390.1 TauD/TfdA family dioxygenase [Actinoplanes bogorensis]
MILDHLSPHFGAVVHGVDLLDADAAEIRAALVQHKVLFFRDQKLDDDAQIELGRRIGELTAAHPVVGGVDAEHPEVYALDSTDNGFADVWHTDVTFMRRPPLGSILRAVTLPPTGGDTNWADAQLAYDSLSAPVRSLVDGLVAVHDGNREFGYYLAQRRGGRGNEWDGEVVTKLEPIEHPVIRVHPETGRRGIFVNPGFTSHIVGVSEFESRAILDLLYAHLTKPEHIVRHRWRAGDVAMWDNRSTSHYANRDYGTERRIMHRITLRGDVPVGVS